ncbi:MAG: TatD family hydrolase [Chitinophagaceae bacterium]
MIDTHCHVYLDEFKDDIKEVISTAISKGVNKFYLPCIDSAVIPAMMNLEVLFPENCIAMMGLHPCSVKENVHDELRIAEECLLKRTFAAIGETGLDFYWDRTFEQEQYMAFNRQIEWALQYDLPVVIHSRNSTRECIDTVRQHQKGNLKGVFHCFSGDADLAHEIIGMGFYLGIGGVITYKNAGLSEVIKGIDLEHLVLETDAPYLSPVPFRGKRNEPAYLTYVIDKLAEVKGVSVEEVIEITTGNAEKLFGG